MAVVFALAGGMVGFWVALVSLVVFDSGALTALAIWSGVGIASLVFGLALILRRDAAASTKPMTADASAA
ncbi:hypothetical protein [Pseudotabrizicola formosa]|uniref:hypothetical protein n=1 Tax=Pseudotabrizicola formosa TaxID=2030009 RepID=UPI0011AFC9F1|nr:hypothetical protein [Pseudotabrizicola formosa]